MSAALKALEDMYVSAQKKLSVMLIACPTKTDHDAVLLRYQELQENYYACLDRTFHENDAALQALVLQAEKNAVILRAIEAQLGDIAKVLDVLSTAVKCSVSIVAMAIPV